MDIRNFFTKITDRDSQDKKSASPVRKRIKQTDIQTELEVLELVELLSKHLLLTHLNLNQAIHLI